MRTTYVALLAAASLLAACGSETTDPEAGEESTAPAGTPITTPTVMPTEVPTADGQVTTAGPVTVLDEGGGAEACLGGVLDSYPPQCGGPELLGWDWSDHEGDYEESRGTRWGDFVLTGTFDGRDITPTDVVPAAEWDAPADPPEDDPFRTPCPEPDGGWQPIDPATATDQTRTQAIRIANRLPDYARLWVDHSVEGAPDPDFFVLNVAVTGDVAEAEAAIREVWGGALCVSEAMYTERELRRVQQELMELPGITSAGSDLDQVEVSVVYDDGSIQAWADLEYGAGVVVVSSTLVPAEG